MCLKNGNWTTNVDMKGPFYVAYPYVITNHSVRKHTCKLYWVTAIWNPWGLCCHNLVSRAWQSNYISQNTVGCNHLFMPSISVSGTKVLICSVVLVWVRGQAISCRWIHTSTKNIYLAHWCDWCFFHCSNRVAAFKARSVGYSFIY